jgi:hypothetical protein
MSDVNVLKSILDSFKHQYSRLIALPPSLQEYAGLCLAEYAGSLIAKPCSSGIVAIPCEMTDTSDFGFQDLLSDFIPGDLLVEEVTDIDRFGVEFLIEEWEDPCGHRYHRAYRRSE